MFLFGYAKIVYMWATSGQHQPNLNFIRCFFKTISQLKLNAIYKLSRMTGFNVY